MRPVVLTMKGFRSFRERCELRFDDLGLFAIVGETGAGKSSILQAICYALYGKSTLRVGSKALVHGAEANLTVALTFDVRGERWHVERSAPREAYPQASHTLWREGDAVRTRVSSDGEVTKAITALVGLSFEAFTRSVLLPQGEFQLLLFATKADRLPILKQVLGLERLDRLKDLLRAPHEEAKRRLDRFDAEITACGTALEERLAAREEQAKLAATRVERLGAARTAIAHDDAAINAATTERGALVADRAVLAKREALGTSFVSLRAVERSIDEEVRRTIEARDENLAASAVERDWLDAARADGRDGTEAQRVLAALDAAVSARRTVDEDEASLRQERDTHTREAADAAVEEERLPALRAARDAASAEAESAEAAFARAARDEAERRSGYAKMVLERAQAEVTCTDAGRAETRYATAGEALARAAGEHEAAIGSGAAADAALAEAHRIAGLLAFTSTLHAGMACPICTQEIPADFAPHPLPNEAALHDAKSEADALLAASRQHLDTARAEEAKAAEALRIAHTARDETAARVEFAERALRELGESAFDEPLRTLRLAELAGTLEAAKRDSERLRAGADAAKRAYDQAVARAEHRSATIAGDAERLARRASLLAERHATLVTAVAALPSRFGLDAGLDAELVQAARSEIAAIDQAWSLHDQAERKHISACADYEKRLLQLEKKRATSVAAPLSKLGPLVDDVARAVAAHLGHDVSFDIADVDRERAAENLAQLDAGAVAADVVLAARLGVLEEELHAAEARVVAALASIGLAARDGLESALDAARSESATHVAEANLLRAAMVRRDELRTLRIAFAPNVDALSALDRLLTNTMFPQFVVARRVNDLLVKAGTILRRMTNDRFALHEDFDILDVRLGQTRPAKTLSGGETFLASLALALALGEISAASGSTADALFLDEGFGTLDDETLDAAISELQRRSQGGRLIGLVSHVKGVADFVDDVLRVAPGPGGSVVRRLDDTARANDAEHALTGFAESSSLGAVS